MTFMGIRMPVQPRAYYSKTKNLLFFFYLNKLFTRPAWARVFLSFSYTHIHNLAVKKNLTKRFPFADLSMCECSAYYLYTLIKLLKVGFTARTNSLWQLGLTWNKIRSSNGIWTPDGCQRVSKHPRLIAQGSLFKRINAGAGSEHVHKKRKSYKNL